MKEKDPDAGKEPKKKDKKKYKKKRTPGELKAPPIKDKNDQIIKGDLLFTEPDASFMKRRRTMLIIGVLALFIGIGGISYAVYSFLDPGICGVFIGFFLFVMSIIAIFLSFALLLGKGAKMKYLFHEGGVVDHSVYGGEEIFIPYGNFVGKKKIKKKDLGDVYVLSGPDRISIWLWPGENEANGHLKTILGRVGKDKWTGEIENPTRDRMMTGFAPLAQSIVVIIGGLVTGPLLILTGTTSLKTGLLMIPAVILGFSLILSFKTDGLTPSFRKTMKKGGIDRTLRFNINLATTLFGIVVTLVLVPIVLIMPGAFMPDEMDTERLPDDGIAPDELTNTAENDIDDVIIVKDGESFSIGDMDIAFEGRTTDTLDLYVESGGYLEAENVTFRSRTGNQLSIEIHGNADFRNCDFIGLWGNPEKTNGDGGLEVHGGNVDFKNCRFINATTNLLLISDGKATIEECLFSGAHDDAVECQSASVELDRCILKDCEWTVMCFDASDVNIKDCHVSDVNEGVVVSWSKLTIEDTTFFNVTGTALSWDLGGRVERSGLVFENVGTDIDSSYGMDPAFGTFCFTVPLLFGIVALIVSVFKIRRKKEKNKDGG